MKTFITLICCLAVAGSVNAAAVDPDQKKKKGEEQRQGQQQKLGQAQGQAKAERRALRQGRVQGQGELRMGNRSGRRFQQDAQVSQDAQLSTRRTGKGRKLEVNSDAQLSDASSSKAARRAARQQGRQMTKGDFKVRKFEFKQQGPKSGIASMKFKANNKIKGAHNWHGQKYVVFKNYNSQWHDKAWYHHHHNRIVFSFGSPYYWHGGYWYPAWGYGRSYYPYDGPIYGYNGLPPDQVIANVQASLQAQGYYEGEVDGLLGPLTRAALAGYQRDNGLYTTAAIDEPTLQSLGMG